MMFLEFIAVCLFLNKAHGQSYRSSINTGGKPILRSGVELSAPVPLQPTVKDVEPLWVADLRARIERLVSRHGYEGAKPLIKKTVDETQKKQSVLLDAKVDRDGESEVVFEYEPKNALRSDQNYPMTSLLTKEPDPEWLVGFKAYVKSLINRYGKQRLDGHIRPVIDNIERMHSVRITDVDVDSFGEVVVKYSNLKRRRTRPPYSGGRRRRVNPMDED